MKDYLKIPVMSNDTNVYPNMIEPTGTEDTLLSSTSIERNFKTMRKKKIIG